MLWTVPLTAGAALLLWQLTLATRGKRPRILIMLTAFGLVITAGLLHPIHPHDYPRLDTPTDTRQ